jgi:hypothetical protein
VGFVHRSTRFLSSVLVSLAAVMVVCASVPVQGATSGRATGSAAKDTAFSGDITFAENSVYDEIRTDSKWGIGVMVPLFIGQGVLLERRVTQNIWAFSHFTYQNWLPGSYEETETGRVDFAERNRFQLSIGADRLFSLPFTSLKRWAPVLGVGAGIRRSEVRSSKLDSLCRPRCGVYLASSEVVDAATETAVIGLLRAGIRVREMFVFGERTDLGVIFEQNFETGIQLLSTNQAPSAELSSGVRAKGALLLEMSLKF